MFKKTNAGDQLLIAVKLNKISEISRLVALGVDVDSRIDKSGKTTLHYAAYKGQLSAVKALTEAGADLDVADENGVTALHRAVIDGRSDVVKTLLKAGSSVDKTDESGNTALHEAAWNGYSKCVELLVACKCNVNIHNQTGYTCLHLAAQNGHCKTLQVLLNGGSNPLAKNNYGDTPLHIAVRYGHVNVCEILLVTRINISEQNNDGSTPLHIAASMGHEKLAEMLLRAGSLIGVKNNVGDTARDLAIQDGFKKIAQLLTPLKGGTMKLSKKERKDMRRPHSVDMSNMYSQTTVSTPTTLGTQLWIPRSPDSEASGSKKSWHRGLWKGRKEDGQRKNAAKPKQLTIKFDEMCSIEREYSRSVKKRNEASKRLPFKKSRSKSGSKSQDERICSDPALRQSPENVSSRVKNEKQKSAQSRDDLEVDIAPKKNKKDRGFFRLFRSASDPDIHTSSAKKNSFFSKKHRDKSPPAREVLGNGLPWMIKEEEEVKEKGETEETKERKEKKGKRKDEKKEKDKADEGREKKVAFNTSKKTRGEDQEKLDKKERRKKKDKKHDKEESQSDCSLCDEMTKRSKEKSHSKESKHKELKSRSEKKQSKDAGKVDIQDKDHRQHSKKETREEEKEHRKRKHHRDKEKDKDKDKDKTEKDKVVKERSGKDKIDKDKNQSKTSEKHVKAKEVNSGAGACKPTQCSTCQTSLHRVEAWQERCTSEIDSARRKLEHRLQRLEKRLEEQMSDESQLKEKETREKEYDRVVGRVTDECREVSKSVKETSLDVKGEMRKLIRDGLGRLEFKLTQVERGYDVGYADPQDTCNPELGRNCAIDRRSRRTRSRSSPHLARTPCADCAGESEPRTKISPPSSDAVGNLSTGNSRVRVSQSDALDTLVEKGHKVDDTHAAAQVRQQRQVQEVDRWWREKADEEQQVLYARISELEQMLMISRAGGDCFV